MRSGSTLVTATYTRMSNFRSTGVHSMHTCSHAYAAVVRCTTVPTQRLRCAKVTGRSAAQLWHNHSVHYCGRPTLCGLVSLLFDQRCYSGTGTAAVRKANKSSVVTGVRSILCIALLHQ